MGHAVDFFYMKTDHFGTSLVKGLGQSLGVSFKFQQYCFIFNDPQKCPKSVQEIFVEKAGQTRPELRWAAQGRIEMKSSREVSNKIHTPLGSSAGSIA